MPIIRTPTGRLFLISEEALAASTDKVKESDESIVPVELDELELEKGES